MLPDSRVVTKDLPLVSCIMPTHNRRSFVSKAIEYFLRQDYPNRELIIIDDGTDSISSLNLRDQRLRYLRLERRETIGAKRNLACQESKGEIIVHWDDDDWMADWRLSYQVNGLLSSQVDLCGLDRVLFWNPGAGQTWQYVYPNGSTPWVAGGTFCYTKVFWQSNPFPDLSVGEDTRFVWSNRSKRMLALQENTFYVALIHSRNTSLKATQGRRWQAYPITEIRRLVGDDWDYYVDLSQSGEKEQDSRRNNKNTRVNVPGGTGMKINIGCCDAPMPGFVNVDIVPAAGVEAADLRQTWPWPDDSVEYVRAWDIIEHLPDKIFTMNELWRVLRPGGKAEIAIPTTEGPGAWQDPTHVSFWNRRSFMYYEAGNPYRERFAGFYGIHAKFRIDSERIDQTVDGPRLTIMLEAVKENTQREVITGETETRSSSSESNPDFHVVILSACASNLVACVRSILNSELGLPPDRIIVVDDGARSEAEHQLTGIRWVAGVKPFVF
ncbi:MAG: glycosyltransferase, partial [Acidobacteria bacterium]|nr:glycosyltransferase [Acidobacteriota bacterium]